MESATPFILLLCGFGIVGSFLIGMIVGWFSNDLVFSFLNKNRAYAVHPEMFDGDGNLIPDEILAVRFENDFDDEDDDED
jgi:hypothetical protein